jgi:Ca2+/Na+ antiporter
MTKNFSFNNDFFKIDIYIINLCLLNLNAVFNVRNKWEVNAKNIEKE